MKKVQKLFLWFSLLTFVISVVVCVYDVVVSSLNSMTHEDDIYGSTGAWFWLCLNVILITIPFLLSEISLIKNLYIFLKKELSKIRKIFITISSVLSLCVIVMIILIENALFEYGVGNTILLILWPTIIASFILGAIRVGNVKK